MNIFHTGYGCGKSQGADSWNRDRFCMTFCTKDGKYERGYCESSVTECMCEEKSRPYRPRKPPSK